MTLRMADGPVKNLPKGLDAYAGYVDKGGIGITFPQIVIAFPNAIHLSISVHGATAMCGDVESGALLDWEGYAVGYVAISNAQAQINAYGRPKKLWTAHYDPALGPHICSPSCGFDFKDHADGTQWTDHGGLWDESMLKDDFFSFITPTPERRPKMLLGNDNGNLVVVGNDPVTGDLMVFKEEILTPGVKTWTVVDVTQAIHNSNPTDPREYKVS